MEFADILEQTIALLQHQGRISYGALKRRFKAPYERRPWCCRSAMVCSRISANSILNPFPVTASAEGRQFNGARSPEPEVSPSYLSCGPWLIVWGDGSMVRSEKKVGRYDLMGLYQSTRRRRREALQTRA